MCLCWSPFADPSTFGIPFDRAWRRRGGRSGAERRRRGRRKRPPLLENKRPRRSKPLRTRSPRAKARPRPEVPLPSQSSRATRRKVARSRCRLWFTFRNRLCLGGFGVLSRTVLDRVQFGLDSTRLVLPLPLYVLPALRYFGLSLV